eukprot:jgi/Ulvmu1/2043/UM120_0039.1
MEENQPPVSVRWVELIVKQPDQTPARPSGDGIVNFKQFRPKAVALPTQRTQRPVACVMDVETQRKGMEERGHLIREEQEAKRSRQREDHVFHDLGSKTQMSRATQRRQSRQEAPNQRTRQGADASEILNQIAPRRAKKSRHDSTGDDPPPAAQAVAPEETQVGRRTGSPRNAPTNPAESRQAGGRPKKRNRAAAFVID